MAIARKSSIVNANSAQKFISTIFHELKIPISSINGYLSLLLTGELGRISLPQRKVIQKARDLSLYAAELIANLSAMPRLGNRSARLYYEKVCLPDLIRKSIAALNVQTHSRRIKIHADLHKNVGQPIWALPVDMEQIIVNILSNAVKFTPKGRHVYVCASKKGAKIYLSVKDTGIGIPKKALNKIFDDFYRADNVVRQYEGCGLGLSIVNALLKKNKGSISIKSGINKGTTVNIAFSLLTDKEVFESELENYVSRASRAGNQFCLLMVSDMNKGSSGRYQKALYKTISDVLRKDDHIYTIGERKYIAILPDVDYNGIQLVFERLRSALEEREFLEMNRRDKKYVKPAVAAAFVLFPKDGRTKEKLVSCLEDDIKKLSSMITLAKK